MVVLLYQHLEFEAVEEGYVSCPPTVHDGATGTSNSTGHCWNTLHLFFNCPIALFTQTTQKSVGGAAIPTENIPAKTILT